MKSMFLSLLLGTSFTYAQSGPEGHSTHQAVKRKALEVKDQKELTEILSKNDALFHAFLKKDQGLIERAANDLSSAVSKSHGVILSSVRSESGKLKLIKANSPNEKNLAAYESFLTPLVAVVKSYEVSKAYNVFFCPMVKKSWIQNIEVQKEVRNVYAMEMLECGSQETHF